MNIGPNFHVAGKSARVLPPDTPLNLLQSCWQSYEASGDGGFDWHEFRSMTREGHLINCAIYDEMFCHALFGLELMRDRFGPYTSFLFFDLWHGRLVDVAPATVTATFAVSKRWHELDGGGEAPARCLLRGRDGWQRMLPRLGIQIDPRGWITEAQEAFGHGFQ